MCADVARKVGDVANPAHQVVLMSRIAISADRAAFAALFDHFAPRLKGFLMRGGLPAHHAEELTQESMLTVWRKAAQFDAEKANVSTWVYTIARNLRIDVARRGMIEIVLSPSALATERHTAEDDLASGHVEEGRQGFGMDVVDVAISSQRADRVQAAISALPDDQSRVVLLAFFHGKAHADVARELSLPLGTVKSRLRLATQKLRVMLNGLSDD